MTTSRFPILDLLDRPDDLPAALEDQLVSPQLPQLVDQLSLLHPSVDATLPAELRSRILTSGLAVLREDDLRLLLSRPRALLELQQAVLLEGGACWDAVIRRSRGDLLTEPVLPAPTAPAVDSPAWYRSPWAWAANALTGLAAALAVVVFGGTNELRRQLNEEAVRAEVRAEALAGELAALRRMYPPAMPADLPESQAETSVVTALDPPDLPDSDPLDLPEAPKKERSNVEL